MKTDYQRVLIGIVLLISFSLTGCVNEGEGSGPSTRGTGDGDDRSSSASGSGGGLGQGESNTSSDGSDAASSSSSEFAELEKKAFDLVNEYRATKSLPALTYVEEISKICRGHSENMASGAVPFSHDGSEARYASLKISVGWSAIAENIAFNQGATDPAQKAVTGWIASHGHEVNMSGTYTKSGMGVAKSSDGSYYLTQIFLR